MSALPESVLDILQPRVEEYLQDYTIVRRPLRTMDPAQSIAMFAENWTPVQNSDETGLHQPTLNRYLYRIQLMVKHAIEEEGRALFSVDSKILRTILYDDPLVRVGLTSLQESAFGNLERLHRFGVSNQRFLNGDLAGDFVLTSTTTFWVETEMTRENP